jgi:hypothetical protein
MDGGIHYFKCVDFQAHEFSAIPVKNANSIFRGINMLILIHPKE